MPKPIGNKTCARCQHTFPWTAEYFHRDRSTRSGFAYTCKRCACTMSKASSRRMRQQHADRYRAHRRARYHEHKALILAQQRQKRWDNIDVSRAKERRSEQKRRDNHREQFRHYHQAYRSKHRDKLLARRRQLYAENPAKIDASNERRRARKHNSPLNDLTAAQWEEIQVAFHHRCAYCGKRPKGRLTKDHITPYMHNGSNTLWNVVPACGSCNSRKHTRGPLTPVQPLLLTLAASEGVITHQPQDAASVSRSQAPRAGPATARGTPAEAQ